MKKIFKFAAIVAAAAALFSCTEKPEPTPTPNPDDKPGQEQEKPAELNQNIKFTIELTDLTESTAKFKVKHDGAKTDTWHYFTTTESDVAKAIETEVAALVAEGKSLQSSTSKSFTVRGLEAETDYTLVVFGLSTKGETYGEPVTYAFTTTAAPLEGFQVNPAWTVAYIGAGVADDGKTYEHVISVTSTDNNAYLTAVVDKESYDTYGVQAIAEGEVAYWIDYVNQFNQANGTKYDLTALLYTGNVKEGWKLEAGAEYVALAIGADAAGATGYYAVSEAFAIVEEDMTDAYAAWLGDWTITGSNGITQYVTFSKGTANKTYIMTGYEGDDAAGLDVTVNWLAEEEIWVIYNQNLGTYNFGQYGKGDIWFLGEGEDESVYLSELPICLGGTFEDGSLGAIGYEETYELEDGTPMTYKVVTMEYLAYLTDYGQLSYVTGTYETGYPTFPMAFTPATKASTTSTKEFKGAQKMFKGLEAFKCFNFKNAVIR